MTVVPADKSNAYQAAGECSSSHRCGSLLNIPETHGTEQGQCGMLKSTVAVGQRKVGADAHVTSFVSRGWRELGTFVSVEMWIKVLIE